MFKYWNVQTSAAEVQQPMVPEVRLFQVAKKYVRLYAPKNKLNNGKGIIFYVNPPKYTFRKKSMHCFWGIAFPIKPSI